GAPVARATRSLARGEAHSPGRRNPLPLVSREAYRRRKALGCLGTDDGLKEVTMTLTDAQPTPTADAVSDVPLLRGLSVLVPPTVLVQAEVAKVFGAQPGVGRLAQRLVATSFGAAGVATRHTVIEELSTTDWDRESVPMFFDHEAQELHSPGTAARNALYAEHAGPLATAAARAAIDDVAGLTTEDVTHVITVSCTGFYAPGP